MFIVYFSGCAVTVNTAGHTRWGQVVREPNTMFIVYFSGSYTHCIMMAVHGGGRCSENLTCLFCISVVKTQCKPVKTYSVSGRNMVAPVQCG